MIKQNQFKLRSQYKPSGDQPQAIAKLVGGIKKGYTDQTLLGVTGSGKTFTIANVIAQIQKPTLVIAHNKTLAAQLTQEYRSFFPNNAVEYFVSYYDYYQPEAYMPNTDTYIEKEAQINEEIDRLRHSATQSLLTRQDVIIVASVSCIYNIGSPDLYQTQMLILELGQEMRREQLISKLVDQQFVRQTINLVRGTFRVVGSNFDIIPVNEEIIYRIIIERDIIKNILVFNAVSRKVIASKKYIYIYPAKHYVTDKSTLNEALKAIRAEAQGRVTYFKSQGKLLEADRIERRTKYDMEMIEQIGFVNGIENYSRYFDGRASGEKPHSLLEYFPPSTRSINSEQTSSGQAKDYLLVIDESHVTIPQIRGMYEGDRSRKQTLIDYGFRLPSAIDNRPLKFDEFDTLRTQSIYTTATPSQYELQISKQVVEQIVRPTGLIDPEIIIKPITCQIDDLKARIDDRVKNKERVLVTTLTKKMAEDLSAYLEEKKYKVHYLHSGVDTLERIETLTKLRTGAYDIIVGVNLLREGLDLPEVSLVAILDADKEGFLRSETSLIQTIGRAARNINGQVILYADTITRSMERAISETNRRRKIQIEYNKKHGITPKSIQKEIKDITQELQLVSHAKKVRELLATESLGNLENIDGLIKEKEKEMKHAAKELDFELATILRDEVIELGKIKRITGK
ncbi:excinuclease ABC subunit B [Candidatus Berkelbacteria bacterium CG06_land_8_20_14_3_00_43_10]|nr:MAG: excinuclease ABC subunit B [Candidatus Berkelbacteria bacterium CG2_30_43_20]PIU87567.1 MAG: excinuclease ABC subunit B [Candidatus Berkelbacteria bacterium CG06_land_8_20_14_3_00_43_10]